MEIIVEGRGKKFITPDQIEININFKTVGKSYEEVLEQGNEEVNFFLENIIISNGFKAIDMKTRKFVVREEKRYDNKNDKYIFEGFSFNQNATLKFTYDKKRLSSIMNGISKLLNPPVYQIDFSIKNKKLCRNELLYEAYKDAEDQAVSIAQAAGKNLKDCIKVDFKPFSDHYTSNTNFSSYMVNKEKAFNPTNFICNTFTPEDIELTEILYCIWSAE